MLKEFWKQRKPLIQFTGSIVAIGAIFLAIPTTENKVAKIALANIQVFWLILLAICLMLLFVNFIKLVWKNEKRIEARYSIPIIGAYSVTLGAIFIWILVNLWNYIFALYSDSFTKLISMVSPIIPLVLTSFFLIFVEKNKKKFTRFSLCIIDSFALAFVFAAAFASIQEALLKYFYVLWTLVVLLGSFTLFFVLFILIIVFHKKKLFST
jgi:hypothetical protein